MQHSCVNVSPLVDKSLKEKYDSERKMEMDNKIIDSINAMVDIKNINSDHYYEEHGSYESIPNSQEKFNHKTDYNEYGYNIVKMEKYYPTEDEVYTRFNAIKMVLKSLIKTAVYNHDGKLIDYSYTEELDQEFQYNKDGNIIDVDGIIIEDNDPDWELKVKWKMLIKVYKMINKYPIEYEQAKKECYQKQITLEERNKELKSLLDAFIACSNIVYDDYLTLLALYHIDPFIKYNI